MRAFPILVLTLALCACKAASAPDNGTANAAGSAAQTRTIPLRITTDGKRQSLTMEVAVTEQEQERGLMQRTSLPPGHGMLFPFTLPRMASFWMKDTPLPLDLLFVRPDGTIAVILHGKPNDLHPISAGEPVSAVVEIGAGEAQRLGILPGARVEWGDCREGRQPTGVPINPVAFCPTPP